MGEHEQMDTSKYFTVEQQTIRVEDVFSDGDLILDLGGGGEGVIGQLRGRQVVAVDRRADELEEAADGPIKVIADACELPLLGNSFDAVTAFFFLMYLPIADRPKALAEAFRVLKPGGKLHLWDLRIPARTDELQEVYCVMLRIHLPDREIGTGYGAPWVPEREMSAEAAAEMAEEAGFEVVEEEVGPETFRMVFRKPADLA